MHLPRLPLRTPTLTPARTPALLLLLLLLLGCHHSALNLLLLLLWGLLLLLRGDRSTLLLLEIETFHCKQNQQAIQKPSAQKHTQFVVNTSVPSKIPINILTDIKERG